MFTTLVDESIRLIEAGQEVKVSRMLTSIFYRQSLHVERVEIEEKERMLRELNEYRGNR